MTTLAQLAKYAKKSTFHEQLTERGFQKYLTMDYIKKDEESGFYWKIAPQILTSRENVRFWCHIWVPEFREYNMDNFPKDIGMIVKLPTYNLPDWDDLWPISDEDKSIETLNRVIEQMKIDVFPWFESINTVEKLINAMSPSVRQDDREAMISRVLAAY